MRETCTKLCGGVWVSGSPDLVLCPALPPGKEARSAFMPGKRSSIRERKRGTSSATNLDIFMSRSVRIMRKTSDCSTGGKAGVRQRKERVLTGSWEEQTTLPTPCLGWHAWRCQRCGARTGCCADRSHSVPGCGSSRGSVASVRPELGVGKKEDEGRSMRKLHAWGRTPTCLESCCSQRP